MLIDVREEDEFSSGIIPANIVLTIPRGKIEFVANEKIILPQEKRQEKNDKITKKGYKNGKKEIQCRI